MGKTAIIAAACTIIIVGAAFAISLADSEKSRSEAVMFKACVENGGSFLRTWAGRPYCERGPK